MIVHGGWSNWTSFDSCSNTCGVGLQSKTRTCDHPVPSSDGRQCQGHDIDYRVCMDTACKGKYMLFHTTSNINIFNIVRMVWNNKIKLINTLILLKFLLLRL